MPDGYDERECGQSAKAPLRTFDKIDLLQADQARAADMPDISTPNLPSRHFEDTARFYGQFGFEQTWRDPGWMILKRGDLTLEFFPFPDLDPAQSSFSCCFRMSDVGTFFELVSSAGVPETTKGWPRVHRPKREPWGGIVGALIDPDGSLIRLVQASR